MSKCFFTIQKKYLTEDQIGKLINHDMYGYDLKTTPHKNTDPDVVSFTGFTISVETEFIRGSSNDDSNFNMKGFIEKIGVDFNHVDWVSYK